LSTTPACRKMQFPASGPSYPFTALGSAGPASLKELHVDSVPPLDSPAVFRHRHCQFLRAAQVVMAEPTKSPSRLRVALLEPEPIRVQGFVTLFQDHPRIEFVVFELAQFLADQEFKLALVGLHGDKLPLPLVGTIHGLRPDVRLIVMGPEANDEVILQAISSGAKAYLEANATPHQVEQAIEIVNQGSIWAPRRVLSIFVDRATRPPRSAAPASAQFTTRETEVLKLLVAARSNREIARTLGIEERTVKAHVAKLMRKVGVENRIALSIYAVTNSIVTPAPE
jgi:DNA-binding NarL/FixJ family response regulator